MSEVLLVHMCVSVFCQSVMSVNGFVRYESTWNPPTFISKFNFFFSPCNHIQSIRSRKNLFSKTMLRCMKRHKSFLRAEQRWLSGWQSLGHLPALHWNISFSIKFTPKIQLKASFMHVSVFAQASLTAKAALFRHRAMRLHWWLAASSGCRWKRPPVLMNRPLIAELLARWITVSPA